MPVVVVRFIYTPDFVSNAIDFVTNSIWSHCEFGTAEGTWLGAHSSGGVEERPADYCQPTRESRYAFGCTQAEYDEVIGGARKVVGTKYNFKDIVGLLIKDRKLTDPRRLICSQFVLEYLEKVWRVLNVLPGYEHLITPETLHLSPVFIGRRTYHLG